MKSEEGRVKNLIVRRGREGKIGKAKEKQPLPQPLPQREGSE